MPTRLGAARFSPVIIDSVRDSIAMTDEHGRFEMTTGRKGAVKAGEYYVYLEGPLAIAGEMTKADRNRHIDDYQLQLDD